MRETKKILIVEELAIFRAALKILLSSDPTYKVVGEASDGMEAIRMADSRRPDLVMIDLFMPKMSGINAMQEIKRQSASTKILVLTDHKAEEHVFIAFRAGARGYILKDASYSELMLAVESLFAGKGYISPSISEIVIQGYLGGRKSVESLARYMLTEREREIFKMTSEGYKNKNIADYLCISPETVKKHRANLMKKLDLHNTSSLTTFAIEKEMAAA